jgi:mxaL protein
VKRLRAVLRRGGTRLRPLLARLAAPGTRSIATALLLVLLAWLVPPLPISHRVVDKLIVFDITQSMNVEDYVMDGRPVDRLTYAKAATAHALLALPCGSRVGFAVFAEYRTLPLLAPVEVCTNYGDLLAALNDIDGRMRWGNASQISKGLFWALRTAKEIAPQPNVVFITDGQEAPPLDNGDVPLFDDLKKAEFHGWVMGAGGDVPRPIPKTDNEGRPLGYWQPGDVVELEGAQATGSREYLSSVREPHLRTLASQTGLEFARLQDFDSLAAALRDSRHGIERRVDTDMDWLPLGMALVLLAWRFRPDGKIAARWPRWLRRRQFTRRIELREG